ncbi:MAG: universal stress protein [Oscillatoriales cyanobacterium RU_3_3]|nr:universal stress protein [Oscillatoriales cyanobacterium RU_3_3]
MLDKILVAVDRSENAEQVLDVAIALAKAMGASLMLLHVLSSEEKDCPQMPLMTTPQYYPTEKKLFEEYYQQWQIYEQQGIEMLRSYTAKAKAEGANADFTQSFGNPGRAICEMAKTWGADSIVMGHRGYSGLKELVLGSASNYVLHHAPCSVFTVKSQIQNYPNTSQETQVAIAS